MACPSLRWHQHMMPVQSRGLHPRRCLPLVRTRSRKVDVRAISEALGSAPDGMRPCCMMGHVSDGVARGSFQSIGGVDCYVSKPKASNGAAIVIAPDIFGAQFINTQLIADRMADAGFTAVIVDYFDGSPLPTWVMECLLELSRPELVARPPADADGGIGSGGQQQEGGGGSNPVADAVVSALRKVVALVRILAVVPAWFAKQGPPPPAPTAKLHLYEGVLAALKSGILGGTPITKVGAVGYCYGGGFCLALAARPEGSASSGAGGSGSGSGGGGQYTGSGTRLIDAFSVAHTTVKVPGSLEQLKVPGLFIAADQDAAFPDAEIARARTLLDGLHWQQGVGPFSIVHYPGTFHGFATRGDPRDPLIRAAKEDALTRQLAWFTAHLTQQGAQAAHAPASTTQLCAS
eukprot:CAMPEP_0202859258 /NCGR_PEP_ID=MMETSP1391-20130828/1452_1 /ASSEMBLY_ACC=CAM_ASM_000867 /TAXON_ID=1034604 /ORGANISM="Chlamydomonas leiostraca, Strain SAG 11-49" /LENGTH=404 /DNA_ID=CAMNT_0049538279 /DNA_START=42 /DNA_END=1256 /DNA_ORIENTATION=+